MYPKTLCIYLETRHPSNYIYIATFDGYLVEFAGEKMVMNNFQCSAAKSTPWPVKLTSYLCFGSQNMLTVYLSAYFILFCASNSYSDDCHLTE